MIELEGSRYFPISFLFRFKFFNFFKLILGRIAKWIEILTVIGGIRLIYSVSDLRSEDGGGGDGVMG